MNLMNYEILSIVEIFSLRKWDSLYRILWKEDSLYLSHFVWKVSHFCWNGKETNIFKRLRGNFINNNNNILFTCESLNLWMKQLLVWWFVGEWNCSAVDHPWEKEEKKRVIIKCELPPDCLRISYYLNYIFSQARGNKYHKYKWTS